ncbi:MAG: hypothetical protein AAF383_15575 [Cyanobacteria bacterium P01_A01_bin.83]
MYSLLYQRRIIGSSELESGDPPMGCVLGILNIEVPIIEFTNFINSLGGDNHNGILYFSLTREFRVIDSDQKALKYQGGCIIICPELKEIWLELLGIGYPEYGYLFPQHVKDYEQQ